MTAVEGCEGSGDVLIMTVTSFSMDWLLGLALQFLIKVLRTRCVVRVTETASGEKKKPDSDSELFEVRHSTGHLQRRHPQPWLISLPATILSPSSFRPQPSLICD